jgi:pyruvate formate lyase activating enzyme
VEVIKRIRKMGFRIKLDTNGSQPEVLQNLIGENLVDYIAMDIKGPLDMFCSGSKPPETFMKPSLTTTP